MWIAIFAIGKVFIILSLFNFFLIIGYDAEFNVNAYQESSVDFIYD